VPTQKGLKIKMVELLVLEVNLGVDPKITVGKNSRGPTKTY